MRTDLNADVGESFGIYTLGDDAALMPHITSANVACGFHAGDPHVMRQTVQLARQHGVAIGAHPGFPDLAGFGRRLLPLDPVEIEDIVAYQVGALAGVAARCGADLTHVKPHGALYNLAADDRATADAIARAVVTVNRHLVLVGLSGSALVAAGRDAGLRTASEVFADRGYTSRGRLLSRRAPGAVLTEPAEVCRRAVSMVRDGMVIADDGTRVALDADTICVHGDTPGAGVLAHRIGLALAEAGVTVAALSGAVR